MAQETVKTGQRRRTSAIASSFARFVCCGLARRQIFVRRPVTVIYRDENFAVLADDESVFEGTPVAYSGGYQLQLALLNRASGPVGHSHAGHSH